MTVAEAKTVSKSNVLKARRKVRNRTCEAQLQEVFSDFSKSPGEQAALSLEMFGEKVTKDLTEQFGEVQRTKFADRELQRLLRMLEKRKKQLDKMYETVALDVDMMSAANAMLLQWNYAAN